MCKTGIFRHPSFNELPSVKDVEVPFFEKLHKEGAIELSQLKELNPMNKDDGIEDFKSFFSDSFDLAHLACHAIWDEECPEGSYFYVTNNFPISLKEIVICRLEIKNNPLVIMNACETGTANPLYTLQFAATFLKSGVRGVVATECAVSDKFAAAFIKYLYSRLLKGIPLGHSLLLARKYFMEKYFNPTGLLYSMYATPNITLRKKER